MMKTKSNYGRTEVEACLSVLVELMTVLGAFREHVVLVGGWIPYFLLENGDKEHVGSLDIDVAVDFQNISEATYQTFLEALRQRGYVPGPQPFIFYRKIMAENGREITVEVDFLAGEYGGTGARHRTQPVQDIRARKTRGCDLAFDGAMPIRLCRKTPDGSKNEITVKIANIVPFLVMKGMALWERYKEKDAYDIYFSISHFRGGIEQLAKIFSPYKNNSLVREGLGKIRKKFEALDAPGPVWVANFYEIDDEEEKERIKRDVYEKVNAFLDLLGIEAFQG